MFDEICKRTARMAASWQVLGWCHGVLNTDNMSIVGVTLDYGPFGWMETFDRDFVSNASDNDGRYSYANQPRNVPVELCEATELTLNFLAAFYLD